MPAAGHADVAQQNLKEAVSLTMPALTEHKGKRRPQLGMSMPALQDLKGTAPSIMLAPAEYKGKPRPQLGMLMPAQQNLKEIVSRTMPALTDIGERMRMSIPALGNSQRLEAHTVTCRRPHLQISRKMDAHTPCQCCLRVHQIMGNDARSRACRGPQCKAASDWMPTP